MARKQTLCTAFERAEHTATTRQIPFLDPGTSSFPPRVTLRRGRPGAFVVVVTANRCAGPGEGGISPRRQIQHDFTSSRKRRIWIRGEAPPSSCASKGNRGATSGRYCTQLELPKPRERPRGSTGPRPNKAIFRTRSRDSTLVDPATLTPSKEAASSGRKRHARRPQVARNSRKRAGTS